MLPTRVNLSTLKELEIVNNTKYLGVTINKHLSLKDYVDSMKTMLANSYNETSCQVQKKSKLNAMIRPILKYASSVWSPHNNASLSTKIEIVQRKA